MPAAPPQTTVDGSHLDYLDGWRGLAIGLLLIGHFFPVPGINFGHVGVNFFFVLSGLLMTRLLFVQHTPIDVFYRRRIARILPAHLAFVAIVSVFFLLTGREISTSEIIAAALLVNNYFAPEVGRLVMPFGHIWSLSVEEHSYILLSLLAVAARKSFVDARVAVGAVAFACAGFAILYSVLYSGPELHFDKWLRSEVSAYGIFVSAFFLLLLRPLELRRLPSIVVPGLMLLGIALHWWSVPRALQLLLGVGAFALAVNLLPQSPQPVRRFLSLAPLRYLGLWSFSLYIWQQPFYLWSRDGDVPTWSGLLVTFCAGLASYYFLEKPARRFLNRTWGRQPAVAEGKVASMPGK